MSKPHRFVVYHVASTMEKKTFYHANAAQMYALKLNNARGRRDYEVTSIEHYHENVVHMVTRRNLMSGELYQEPSNTPAYLSPSCESYWSM